MLGFGLGVSWPHSSYLLQDAGGGAIQPEPASGMELWVSSGQSNHVSFAQDDGQGAFPEGTLQISRSGATSGSTEDNLLIPAVHPLDAVPIDGGSHANAFNPAEVFCTAYKAANPSATMVILPAAEGGTSIGAGGKWSPVAPLGVRLTDMVARINLFFANNPSAAMGGFLWHQGEATNDANYTRYFERMRAYIIGNCPRVTPETPWVVGGLVQQTNSAHRAQSYFPDTIPFSAFSPSDGLAQVGDNLHFTTDALRTMGQRYYDQLAAALANNDVDLGFNDPFGLYDFGNVSPTGIRVTASQMTDGWNAEFVSTGLSRRAFWDLGEILHPYTPYRLQFTAERDDLTDTLTLGIGQNSSVGTITWDVLNTEITATNTPVDFDVEFNPAGTGIPTNGFVGVTSAASTIVTNLRISNMKITRTIQE